MSAGRLGSLSRALQRPQAWRDGASAGCQGRWFASMPEEYRQYYQRAPALPRPSSSVQEQPPPGAAAASMAPLPPTAGSDQRQAAQAVSAWMFPWERRQMDPDAKGLRSWEKVYWGVFVTAVSVFLFSRLWRPAPTPQVDEEKEARKAHAARRVLAGGSFSVDADPFEGLTPKEIQQFVESATSGASASDPYEGMSPEEINAYLEGRAEASG